MTDLLSKERLEKIASWRETYGAGHNVMLPAEEAEELARRELQRREAAEKPAHNWQDEFAGACRTLAAITELLDIPADDVNGEPSQIFDAIESLKTRLAAYDRAAMEPVAWRHRPVDDVPGNGGGGWCGDWKLSPAPVEATVSLMRTEVQPLYITPPLPVVPQTLLRELVDVVWQEAKESTEVPSTKWADELIGKVFPAAQSLPVVPVALCDERAGSGGISKLTGFNALPHGAPLYSAPQAVSQSYRNGIEAAASFLDKQREAFDNEHGQRDPCTGTFEFSNLAASEYSDTLEELAEGIRALNVEPSTQGAVAWRWFDGRGYNSTTDKSLADELVKDGVTVEALGPLQTLPIVPDSGVTAEHRRVIGMLLSVCGAAFELADDACEQEVDGEQCRVVPSDSFVKLSDALDEIENLLPTEDADRPDVFLAWAAMPRAALKSILQSGNYLVLRSNGAQE